MMKLKELMNTNFDVEITHISSDSRQVIPGTMFFCLEGMHVDGHQFVEKAIEKGAVVIVHQNPVYQNENTIYIKVDDVYETLEEVVDVFYDKPSSKLSVYGVTGTNGKSTMTSTIRTLLERFNEPTGYIGTISIEYNDKVLEPSLTTPDIIEMNQILKDMVDDGIKSVALEVSSQGLDLRRVDTLDFDVVSFTNLSLDHLDYHKTMENYYLAKKRLFQLIKPEGKMIINIDDAYGKRLYNEIEHPHRYSVSLEKEADYQAINIHLSKDESKYTLLHQGESYEVKTNMVAMFNVYNSLEVIAMLHQGGYDLKTIIAHMRDLPIVKGRVNFIDEGQNFNAVVDYSHTPDGFEKIYAYLKEITPGRLITVYGNAGGRDHSKRPIMGKISAQYCDLLVITEQDRRHENVAEIKEEMLRDAQDAPHVFIEKRYEAIEYALHHAKQGDTIVVLGKGDERFQHGPKGLESWPGDDRVVRDILKSMKKELID